MDEANFCVMYPIKKKQNKAKINKNKQIWNLNDFGFEREKNISDGSNSTNTWDFLFNRRESKTKST